MITDYQKTLTREEELAAYAAGDTDSLVLSQLAHVVSICRKVCKRMKVDMDDDIISEGVLALVQAVKSYDATRTRLSTWVRDPITWRVKKMLNKQIAGLGQAWDKNRKMETVTINAVDELPEICIDSGEKTVDDGDEAQVLLAGMDELTRSVVEMSARGIEQEEIAKRVCLKCHQVKRILANVRKSTCTMCR